MIEVRHAGPEDGDALGEIHAASWEAAYAPFFTPQFAANAIRDRRGHWHRRIAEASGTILVATLDARPLALSYTVPSPTRPPYAEIYSFYAHPTGWGHGLATTLMTHTLNTLHEQGYAHVHLWTLRDTPQSRRFYTKTGFTETGAETTHDFGDGNPLPQVEYERPC